MNELTNTDLSSSANYDAGQQDKNHYSIIDFLYREGRDTFIAFPQGHFQEFSLWGVDSDLSSRFIRSLCDDDNVTFFIDAYDRCKTSFNFTMECD